MLKVWIDDERPMPDYFNVHVKSYEDFLRLLHYMDGTGDSIDKMSFDHDLGSRDSAYIIAEEIEKQAYLGNMEPFDWEVHSANPVGAKKIRQALENADRYWQRMEHPLHDVRYLDDIWELELVNNDEFIDALSKLSEDMNNVELDSEVEEALFENFGDE